MSLKMSNTGGMPGKVKMTGNAIVEGLNGEALPREVGEVVEVSANVAKYLIAVGKAVPHADVEDPADREIKTDKAPVKRRAKPGKGA